MSNFTYVGRQAIYDRQAEVVAYELLYRNSELNRAEIGDHNQATAELLANVFTSIGLDSLVGGKPAFVNMPKDFLLGHYPLPELRSQLVVEILEHVEPEESVIAALKDIKARGYTLALDDYVFDEHLTPFLELADIIKVDVMAAGVAVLEQKSTDLGRYQVRLLAEKVETREEVELCRRLGFELYQGYYYCKPQVVTGRKIEGNQLALLEVMQKLTNPKVTVEELAELIQRDVALSYKLLRYVNSAMYAFSRVISSVREAVVILGLNTLIKVVNMILIGGLGQNNQELYRATVLRGRMCEELAIRLGRKEESATYFMAGLFSNLDALLGIPMAELIEQLPLSETVKQALAEGRGELGEVLQLVIGYERGADHLLRGEALPAREIVDCYLGALTWADRAVASLEAGDS